MTIPAFPEPEHTCPHGEDLRFGPCPECQEQAREDDLWEWVDILIDQERNT